MPIITISRQLGSGGDEIAQQVAVRLGLHLVGRDLINQAARQAGVPEVALAELDELGLLGLRPRRAALNLYRERVTAIMHELARTGNLLLLGRGGQIVLAGYPHTLHVRIIAPRALRIQRIQEAGSLSLEAATARINASDRARASYLRRYFGLRSHTAELYDLVLNTARLTIEAAVNLICLAADRVTAGKETRSV